MWYKTFEESGGYDCMTDAIYIKDSNARFYFKIVLDMSDYGQEHCSNNTYNSFQANLDADTIVDAFNMRDYGKTK